MCRLGRTGISAAVYERDASADVRSQGYRISLKASGAAALHACLPPALFDLCVATSLRPATRMVFTDTGLTPRFVKPLPPVRPGLDGFGVNRLTLRQILLAGLGDRVNLGKTLLRYEPAPGGQVTAWFADGTSVTADLLVGADGTNSAVRAQLAPGAAVDEARMGALRPHADHLRHPGLDARPARRLLQPGHRRRRDRVLRGDLPHS